MKAIRLLRSLREVPVLPLQQHVAVFSKSMNYSTIDADEGSSVSKNQLKFRWNSANFVGTVEEPLKEFDKKDDTNTVGAWTFLRVKVSPDSNSTFRIVLNLWGEMAESFRERLKPNDFIYVAGTLESYKREDKHGKSHLRYQLTVRELNYIVEHDRGPRSQVFEVAHHEEDEALQGNYKHRLHLWQIFFSNPYEWWDCRENKLSPKHPDFKHKNTGEALWISSTDPPWIKRQLELLDAKMVEKDQDGTQKWSSFLG